MVATEPQYFRPGFFMEKDSQFSEQKQKSKRLKKRQTCALLL